LNFFFIFSSQSIFYHLSLYNSFAKMNQIFVFVAAAVVAFVVITAEV